MTGGPKAKSNAKPRTKKVWVKKIAPKKKLTPSEKRLKRAGSRAKTHAVSVRSGVAPPRKGNAATAQQVLYNFLAPVAAHEFRWPYDGAGEVETKRTACATLPIVDTVTQLNGYVGTYASTSTMLLYQFRQPLRAAVILKRITSSAAYTAYFTTGTTTSPAMVATTNLANTPVPFSYFTANSLTNAPHTQYLYTGSVGQNDDSFVWLGVGDAIAFTPSVSMTGGIIVSLCTNPGCEQPTVVGVPSLNATWTASAAAQTVTATSTYFGYFRFNYFATTASVTLTAVLTVAAGDVMCHIPAPNAALHASWMQNVRMLGSSLLLSNEADQIAKNGSITAAEVNDNNPFYSYNSFPQISALADSYHDVASKGCYGWLKPGGKNVFAFRQCMETTGALIVDTNFRLDDASTFNVYAVSVTNLTGLNFLVALHINLEYFTSDVWAGLDYSPFSTSACTEVLQLAIRHPTFVHNPVHADDIRRFIAGTVRFLRTHSVSMGNLISAAFPGLSSVIKPLAQFAQI